MNDSTETPKQQSLFDLIPFTRDASTAKADKRPAPLQTADKFNFPLQHYAPTEKGQEYQYSITDWIAGLAGVDTRKATKLWADMPQNELSVSIVQLPYAASNGKTYQTDFTNAKGLYLISQNLRATKARPQLKEVREFLATSAAWVELLNRDASAAKVARKQLKEHHDREQGIEKRKDFTATIKAKSKRFNKYLIGRATNTIYAKLFRIGTEYTAKKMIVAELGLTTAQARNMRDYLNRLANKAIEMAEEAATIKMDNSPVLLSDEEILYITKQCARIVAVSANDLAEYAGVDLLSGKQLLKGKN